MDANERQPLSLFPGIRRALAATSASMRAEPIPHLCIDSCVDDTFLRKIGDEFPPPGAPCWNNEDDGGPSHRKHAMTDEHGEFGPFTKRLFSELHSSTFVRAIERLTGIEGLIPDPHLHGGGLHQVLSDGYLKIHADFLMHPTLRLQRRLNLILYLNEHWRDSYGGELELWDALMSRCVQRYAPVWNRAIIFAVTNSGFHGHPEPLSCPREISRKSISVYYYSSLASGPTQPLSTWSEWRRRPGEGPMRPKGIFRSILPPIVYDVRNQPYYVLNRFVPPLAWDMAHWASRKLRRVRRGD